MPDLQQLPPSLQRRQLLELIENQQQTAWRKLRDSGLSETQALAVMPRIRTYCMFALNEYDQGYLAIEEMVEREGRSAVHQQFITDKAAYMLRQIEAGIAELVAIAIRQAIRDLQQPPAREVIPAVRYQPRSPGWQTFLLTTIKILLWLCSMPASFLLAWQFTGSEVWALVGPVVLCVFWLMVRFSWWGLLFPASAVGTALLLSSNPNQGIPQEENTFALSSLEPAVESPALRVLRPIPQDSPGQHFQPAE